MIEARHTRPETTTERSAQAATLGRYITDSGRRLRNEANRVLYYSVGAGLVFTIIAIPLARWVLTPPSAWMVCIPGVLVILLAFLREIPNRKELTKRVTAVGPVEKRIVGVADVIWEVMIPMC